MGFTDVASNLVTLGGFEQVKAAREEEDISASKYERSRKELIALDARLQKTVRDLGELTISSMKLLERAARRLSLHRAAPVGRCVRVRAPPRKSTA